MTQKNHLATEVAATMEDWIASHKWPLNEKIPTESQLMTVFNVSRNTLREAIRGLAQAGLLEIKQGSGTYVRASNRLDTALRQVSEASPLADTMAVRLALESLAAQLAAKNRTEKQLASIQACYKTSQEATSSEAFLQADLAFHLSVVEAAQNPLLLQIYQQILTAVEANISERIQNTDCPVAHMHKELVDAITTQNEEAAIQAVKTSMHRIKDLIK